MCGKDLKDSSPTNHFVIFFSKQRLKPVDLVTCDLTDYLTRLEIEVKLLRKMLWS